MSLIVNIVTLNSNTPPQRVQELIVVIDVRGCIDYTTTRFLELSVAK
jgi:hypothetical protein